MGLTYFKRYRMEIDLERCHPAAVAVQPEYELIPWDDADVRTHAEAKYRSFRDEIDASVFPCLSTREGCLRLMQEISKKQRFIPEATWLLVHYRTPRLSEPCGTIQGLLDYHGYGSIQNVGITPSHRGRGLGTALVYAALEGFRRVGLKRAFLEVTAQNDGAVRLYHRLGFIRARTNYKAVELVP